MTVHAVNTITWVDWVSTHVPIYEGRQKEIQKYEKKECPFLLSCGPSYAIKTRRHMILFLYLTLTYQYEHPRSKWWLVKGDIIIYKIMKYGKRKVATSWLILGYLTAMNHATTIWHAHCTATVQRGRVRETRQMSFRISRRYVDWTQGGRSSN